MEDLTIPYDVIKEFIFLGVKWEYESFNYRAAKSEHQIELRKSKGHMLQTINNGMFSTTCVPETPIKIKQNHIVWRTGKLRHLSINPQGIMHKFAIGHRFNKTFYLEDFGVIVKPRIYVVDDKLNLISRGLAIEEH